MSNANFLWENILKHFKENEIVNEDVLNTWFLNSSIDNVDFKNLTVSIVSSNSLISNYLENFFDNEIKNALKNNTGLNFVVFYDYVDNNNNFIEDKRKKESDSISSEQLILNNFLAKDKPSGAQNFYQKQSFSLDDYKAPEPKITSTSKHNPSLNKNFTFENFIVGEGNQYAHNIAHTVAMYPGQYNPVFIYGGVGLGKTHLLHAIGNELEKEHPEFKIECVTSEQFLTDFMRLINTGGNTQDTKINEAFQKKYRQVDALLIDDIQFLVGKNETQNAFFHTFNDLQLNNKQIVLISDRSPSQLDELEDRLVSRFESGITADITPPGYETITAILKLKCKEVNLELDEAVMSFIAGNIHQNTNRNIRELEGIVKELKFLTKPNEKPNLTTAESIVKKRVNIIKKKIDPTKIINVVSEHYNVSVSDLLSAKRSKDIVNARMMAIYLCRDLTELSLPAIGKSFNKDHSTIFYAISKISETKTEDSSLADDIEVLKNKLNN